MNHYFITIQKKVCEDCYQKERENTKKLHDGRMSVSPDKSTDVCEICSQK